MKDLDECLDELSNKENCKKKSKKEIDKMMLFKSDNDCNLEEVEIVTCKVDF